MDVRDLVLLSSHINGTRTLDALRVGRVDLNQDGTISAIDRTLLADLIACRNCGAEDDFDQDELSNREELRLGTNPMDPDTDHDSSLDGWEVAEQTDPMNSASVLRALVIAGPPVQVIHPLIQDTDTNMLGAVLACPPVQVIHPLVQDVDTNMLGVVMARPPVLVHVPEQTAEVEKGDVPVGRPVVKIHFLPPPEDEEVGASPAAFPQVQVFLPELIEREEAGAVPVALPPVKVTTPPPR